MNSLTRLIGTLRYAGMRFTVEGERLVVTGATGRLTDGLRAQITEHKPDIIAVVNRLPDGCVVPHVCMDIGSCDPGHCQQAAHSKHLQNVSREGRAA